MVTHTHNFYWCSKSFCCCCFFFVLFHHHHHHQMVRKKEKFKTFQKKKKKSLCVPGAYYSTQTYRKFKVVRIIFYLFVYLFVHSTYHCYMKKKQESTLFSKKEREREKILKYLKYTSVTQLVKKRITNDNQTHTHTEFLTLFLF